MQNDYAGRQDNSCRPVLPERTIIMETKIKRGQIYYADLEPIFGSEQGGIRPVLVLQNDQNNQSSPTTIIAPITCQHKAGSISTHVYLNHPALDLRSIALLEQIRTIDKQRLGRYIGSISESIMREVERATLTSLDLKSCKGEESK